MTTDAPASIFSPKSTSQPADQMLELFDGIGGFARALTSSEFGFHVPVVVELDAYAQHSYLAAFPAHRRENVVGNIRTLTLRHDDSRIPGNLGDRVTEPCNSRREAPRGRLGLRLGV